MPKIGNDWDNILKDEFEKEYYLELREFLKKEYVNYKIYPPMNDIFNALKYTSYSDCKVLLLGQDPYINEGEAQGLAFSVNKGVKIPPSLRNIYKEIADDVSGTIPSHGELIKWTEQGVLLLNTCLTVRAKNSNSHRGKGWEIFTDKIISILNEREKPLVFMLWGNSAISKTKLISEKKHLVLTAKHPSPLARGAFFGSKHFSKANEFLKKHYSEEINWQID